MYYLYELKFKQKQSVHTYLLSVSGDSQHLFHLIESILPKWELSLEKSHAGLGQTGSVMSSVQREWSHNCWEKRGPANCTGAQHFLEGEEVNEWGVVEMRDEQTAEY